MPSIEDRRATREFYEVYSDSNLPQDEWERRMDLMTGDNGGFKLSEVRRPQGKVLEAGYSYNFSDGEDFWTYAVKTEKFWIVIQVRGGKVVLIN